MAQMQSGQSPQQMTRGFEKKRVMWFRAKSSIGKKEANIVTFFCLVLGVICLLFNMGSMNYYKYCFTGVRTQAEITDVRSDSVAYWDRATSSQKLKNYTNLYVTYDGIEKIFEKSNCTVTGAGGKGDFVSVAYLPGVKDSTITDFSWGTLVRNIIVTVLFILMLVVCIHERRGYAYNKRHMKVRKVVKSADDEIEF